MGVPRCRFSLEEFTDPGTGTIRAIENKATAIDTNLVKVQAALVEDQRTLDDVNARLGKPFPHTEALTSAAARVEDIDTRLAKAQAPTPATSHTATLVDAAGRAKADTGPDKGTETATPARPAWSLSFPQAATHAIASKPTTAGTKATPPRRRGPGRDGGVEK